LFWVTVGGLAVEKCCLKTVGKPVARRLDIKMCTVHYLGTSKCPGPPPLPGPP
jgi:hypothetical protein